MVPSAQGRAGGGGGESHISIYIPIYICLYVHTYTYTGMQHLLVHGESLMTHEYVLDLQRVLIATWPVFHVEFRLCVCGGGGKVGVGGR